MQKPFVKIYKNEKRFDNYELDEDVTYCRNDINTIQPDNIHTHQIGI